MRLHIKDGEIRNETLTQLAELDINYRPKTAPHRPSVLLVDDDPLFLKQVAHAASKENISVTYCSSMAEVEVAAVPNTFDAAVIDYYLDGMADNMRGVRLAQLLGATPTVLVSQRQECVLENEAWPENVRFYLNKGRGPHAILETALQFRREKT